MSLIILKTGDLDLDIQEQIGLQTFKCCFKILNWLIWNLSFTHELVTDHLKVMDELKLVTLVNFVIKVLRLSIWPSDLQTFISNLFCVNAIKGLQLVLV